MKKQTNIDWDDLNNISEKTFNIIEEDKILTSSAWGALTDLDNPCMVILYPCESIFSEKIENLFEPGDFTALNIMFNRGKISMRRGYLSSISFESVTDAINFVKAVGLNADFSEYLKRAKVSLSCYNNAVESLKNSVEELEEYVDGRKVENE